MSFKDKVVTIQSKIVVSKSNSEVLVLMDGKFQIQSISFLVPVPSPESIKDAVNRASNEVAEKLKNDVISEIPKVAKMALGL